FSAACGMSLKLAGIIPATFLAGESAYPGYLMLDDYELAFNAPPVQKRIPAKMLYWALICCIYLLFLFFEALMGLPSWLNCQPDYTYADGDLLICPECAHEWKEGEITEEQVIIKDAHGNVLADGDSVTVIKDLKIKGSSSVVKVGTKVKSI